MKKLLPEPHSIAITRNEARAQIFIDDWGDLWISLRTPRGQMGYNVASNFDIQNDPTGVARDFFLRIKEGDKLCDGCRFRSHVTRAVENYTENVQSPEGKNPNGPRYL